MLVYQGVLSSFFKNIFHNHITNRSPFQGNICLIFSTVFSIFFHVFGDIFFDQSQASTNEPCILSAQVIFLDLGCLGGFFFTGFLEDHPGTCKWSITMVIVSSLKDRVVAPLPNGLFLSPIRQACDQKKSNRNTNLEV